MNTDPEILVLSFLTLGGVVMILPLVLLGKINILGILKTIAAFFMLLITSVIFYILSTDSTLIEILTLEADSIILPNRILVVSYVMIATFTIMLPIAFIKKITNANK